MNATAATVTVVDCWGRARATLVYPDGESYNCPFCGAGVIPSRERDLPCPSPWCPAHPAADATEARARFLDRDHVEALGIAEARWRAGVTASAMHRQDEDRETKARVARERHEQAERAGQCVACAVRDYYRPRFVRHRGGRCPVNRER